MWIGQVGLFVACLGHFRLFNSFLLHDLYGLYALDTFLCVCMQIIIPEHCVVLAKQDTRYTIRFGFSKLYGPKDNKWQNIVS